MESDEVEFAYVEPECTRPEILKPDEDLNPRPKHGGSSPCWELTAEVCLQKLYWVQ